MKGEILPVSVLIPTMNRSNSLKRTLVSYLAADYVPMQVVIVDQSENDITKEEIGRFVEEYPDISFEYIYQDMPSLTKARNNALKAATNDIVICSDDDIDVYKDTLKNVYDIMSKDEYALVAGINDNETGHSSAIGYLWGTRSFLRRNKGHVTKAMLGRYPDSVSGRVETEWAMGYFFSVKKSLVEKWGIKWDENLTSYAYAEDLDFSYIYCKKAKNDNLMCVLDENVHVLHLTSNEHRIPSIKSTYMYVANRAYISNKYNMGFGSNIAMAWCDLGKIIEKTIKKEKPEDLISARRFLRKNKKDIKKGIFNYKF